MNTSFTQPSTNYRPVSLPSVSLPSVSLPSVSLPSVSLPSVAQGMYVPKPGLTSGGTNGGGARPAAGSTAGTGSFLERIVGQIEQLIERVVMNLIERVLGGVMQKLESALGIAPSAPQAAPQGLVGDPNAALMTRIPTAENPGAMMLDLPPLQLSVTQTNSQNQTQSQTVEQPAGEGSFLSSVFDFLGGVGEKLGSVWEKVKNAGSSIFGGAWGVFNKVSSVLGF